MSLIKCPECGENISDKSKCCIHCGYPLEIVDDFAINETNISNKEQYFDMVVDKENEQHMSLSSLHLLKDVYKSESWSSRSVPGTTLLKGIDVANIDFLKEQFLKMGYVMSFVPSKDNFSNPINSKIEEFKEQHKREIEERNKPLICPRCGSENIAIGERGFSLFSGFWGSNKTTNRCGKCGYSWQPK